MTAVTVTGTETPNLMKKIFLILLVTFASTTQSAERITRLVCDVTSKQDYSTGNKYSESGPLNVEVHEFGREFSIYIVSTLTGLEAITGSNFPSPNQSADDFSNANKWDVRNSRVNGDRTTIQRITIDRAEGTLTFAHDFRLSTGSLYTRASGRCRRASSERKF